MSGNTSKPTTYEKQDKKLKIMKKATNTNTPNFKKEYSYLIYTTVVTIIIAIVYPMYINYYGDTVVKDSNDKNTSTSNTSGKKEKTIVPTIIKPAIMNTLPHNASSFTQGLYISNSIVYESGGLYEKSFLRSYHLDAPHTIVNNINLPSEYFAEGMTVLNNSIYQLTWREYKIFVYDLISFKLINTIDSKYEGWGLTHNNDNLILSDGSNKIYYLNQQTFETIKEINISYYDKNTRKYYDLHRINELEYINDTIYANIWGENMIAIIDPNTGYVITWIDLRDVEPYDGNKPNNDAVLNGIAYDLITKRLYITGKLWPKMYEIKI